MISSAQSEGSRAGTTRVDRNFAQGDPVVDQCTPWHHLKCIAITGSEAYADGRDGKLTRHWWRMSYIGKACKEQHGRTLGVIFEGFFAVPHYIGVAVANGCGSLVHLIRGTKEEERQRKEYRRQRREGRG